MNINGTLRLTILGGGAGTSAALAALRILRQVVSYPINITVAPAVTDGGNGDSSTGVLRTDYGVIALGDIGHCMHALHPQPHVIEPLLGGGRFGAGALQRHTPRNIAVLAYLKHFGPNQSAIDTMCHALGLEGRIVPSTFTPGVHLCASTFDGTEFASEAALYEADLLSRGGVDRIWLSGNPAPNPALIEEIKHADLILIPPGTPYCSLFPNFLLPEVRRVLVESSAPKLVLANLVNRPGHVAPGSSVLDHVRLLETQLGEGFFDAVLYNIKPLSDEQRQRYGDGSALCFGDEEPPAGLQMFGHNLLMNGVVSAQSNDTIASLRAMVRHDPLDTARALRELLPILLR